MHKYLNWKGEDVMAHASRRLSAGKIVGRVLIVILTTLIMAVIALYLLMLVIAKGPSESAKRLFVNSVQETSAIKFLANWYYTDEQIAEYRGGGAETEIEETNTALVNISQKTDENGNPAPDGEAPRKATELIEVSGSTFKGKLLKISDPSRVFVGISGEYGEAYEGMKVADMIEKYGAQAGTNAGGFVDLNGVGNGGTPLGLVISEGQLRWGDLGTTYEFVIGFDQDNILHIGRMTAQQALDLGLRDAVCWGDPKRPLIVNGVPGNEQDSLGGGFNPRTAIGQTADGTVLLLVINGRATDSLGATYDDLTQIMLQHGAVNAMNLDGGSSSLLYLDGKLENTCSSLYGPRRMPTCWLVAPES